MANPTDIEVINAAIDTRLLDLHTSMPGTVVVYNAATQTVDVQPAIKRPIEKVSGALTHEKLPVVMNVPVLWLEGGGFSLRFPLVQGNTVWLMFSEAAMSQWRATGQVSEPGDLRRFDLSYAAAIPAGHPVSGVLPPIPPGEANMATPGVMSFGNPLTAVAVALAPLVEAAIAAAITGHNHGLTAAEGAPTLAGVLGGDVQSTAADNLKAMPPSP